MFLPESDLAKLNSFAAADLSRYLYSLHLQTPGPQQTLDRVLAELGKDEDFAVEMRARPASQDAHQRYEFTLHHICQHIEARGYYPLPNDMPATRQFLDDLRGKLSKLAVLQTPWDKDPQAARDIVLMPKGVLSFATHLMQQRGWSILHSENGEQWFKESGFASWLLVRYENSDRAFLHLIYNRDELSDTPDPLARAQRYEKVFLHEIAHARLHSDYIKDKYASDRGKPTHVMPRHELEASVYAYSIRSIVLGMISRLTRLLDGIDNVWRA